jgi:ligand-binding SRPBCC domain-containing protein
MQNVHDQCTVHAPIERLFALSTRIELVQQTLGMRPVSGTTTGHVHMGSRVEWRGWKFGIPAVHHTLITRFEPPHPRADNNRTASFEDTQEKGRFAFFQHEHLFTQSTQTDGSPRTTMADNVQFSLPFGWLGRIVAQHIVAPYIRKLVAQRFATLKAIAEGDEWPQWVS